MPAVAAIAAAPHPRTRSPPAINARHDQSDVGMEVDGGPDLDRLPRGNDPFCAVDVAPDEILEEVVAVETATPLPDLGDPWPDRVSSPRRRDRPE
jgi:hypothetical protein